MFDPQARNQKIGSHMMSEHGCKQDFDNSISLVVEWQAGGASGGSGGAAAEEVTASI